jgi:hypothetical protein
MLFVFTLYCYVTFELCFFIYAFLTSWSMALTNIDSTASVQHRDGTRKEEEHVDRVLETNM